METIIFVLKVLGGLATICLFVFLIFYSIDDKPLKLFKYLLSYIVFFVSIGFLFFLFGEASIYIGLLAGIGWMIFIVMGSRSGGDNLPGPDDAE
ncbi:hypothetical protein ACFL2E_06810 [Thermodesulfobacteriota bacterium]